MRRVLAAAATVILVGLANAAWAAPETVVEPMHALVGPATSGRFGSAISCSNAVAATNNRSLVAVGAPQVSSGAGRVYVYDTSNPPQLIQTITSPSAGNDKHFGAALTFFSDVNGDGKQELMVGMPDENSAQGTVYVYLSQAAGDPFQSTPCDSHQEASQGYGGSLLRINTADAPTPLVVVGAPEAGEVSSVTISFAMGSCTISADARFTVSGPGGRYGQSLAEVDGSGAPSDLLIGMPEFNANEGEARNRTAAGVTSSAATGSAGQRLGSAVAGSGVRNIRAISLPGANAVRAYTTSLYTLACTKTIPMSDAPLTSGLILADLFGSFLGYTGDDLAGPGTDTTIASYRDEADTGGSLGIFSVQGANACGADIKPINNCLYDPEQEQGSAITGGGNCRGFDGDSNEAMLLTGSPGYGSDRGLVSIYFEGAPYSATPQPCDTPTPTATPTGTPTSTPTDSPTPTPTSTSGGAQDGAVIAQPGAALPAPILLSMQGNRANIGFAKVLFSEAYLRRIMAAKKFRTLKQAERYALTNSYRVVVFRRVASTVSSASIAPAIAAATKKQQTLRVSVRKNQVALRGLKEGQRYQVTYRIVLPKITRKTQQTKTSPPLVFTQKRS
jgi:hypothetical protein